ncbi:MAG: RNA polymerase sigma factor [Armatimonadetes bacterium]|nr:RNA polymerase sigma factor [Armatimonadota bacterium]
MIEICPQMIRSQLYAWLLVRTRNRHLADDFSQEVLLNCMRNIGTKEDPWTLEYVLAAARNTLYSAWRSATRYRKHVEFIGRGLSEIDSKNVIEVAIATMDACQIVQSAFARLKLADAEILRRHCMEGEALSEIAKTAHEPIETVRSRLKRAKRRFRKTLELKGSAA